jgi:tellurite resistance protein TerC
MTPQERPAATFSPWRAVRKVVVAVIGTTVLAVGVALIVLPGPAVVVIPLGLGILGTEFLWARRLLQRLRQGADRALRRPGTEKPDT